MTTNVYLIDTATRLRRSVSVLLNHAFIYFFVNGRRNSYLEVSVHYTQWMKVVDCIQNLFYQSTGILLSVKASFHNPIKQLSAGDAEKNKGNRKHISFLQSPTNTNATRHNAASQITTWISPRYLCNQDCKQSAVDSVESLLDITFHKNNSRCHDNCWQSPSSSSGREAVRAEVALFVLSSTIVISMLTGFAIHCMTMRVVLCWRQKGSFCTEWAISSPSHYAPTHSCMMRYRWLGLS